MYKAKVVKLKVSPHPNADRLQLGNVWGIQVIVGLDTQDGDIGVFFPQDGQLSEEFLSYNNLYRHSEKNQDADKSGYFGDNGRVTAEKLRGEKSDGFWCPLSCFEYTGYNVSKLKPGDEFDELNGHKICKKYYTPATQNAMGKRAKRTQANYNLPRHYDTEQLKYNLHQIERGDYIIVTEKCHGTSTRIGNVKVERKQKLSWWQKLYNKLPLPKYPETVSQYEFVVGTRNTIASEWVNPDSSDYYRIELANPLDGLLKKGEVIYAEIVGFDNKGKPIMNPHSTNKLPDIKKQYGETMTYTYGCAWNDVNKPQRKMLVYRITQVNEDGFELDLTWLQIKKRCRELGLEYVPEIEGYHYTQTWADTLEKHTENLERLLRIMEKNELSHPSLLDNSHIREGLVLRLEKANGNIIALKHKSWEFGILEGYLKQDDTYIDTEEIA